MIIDPVLGALADGHDEEAFGEVADGAGEGHGDEEGDKGHADRAGGDGAELKGQGRNPDDEEGEEAVSSLLRQQ